MGFTFYANRFDTDDLVYRLLTLLAMFGVAVLATTIPSTFAGATSGFPLAYVGVRIVLVVLYARASRHVEEARALATTFLLAFSVAVLIWLASLALARPWNYVLWGVALAIELLTPIPSWRLLRAAPVHPRHIPERFGLLTLIVLGESVLAVVLGVSTVSWNAGSTGAAAAGFVTAAALWWIYFDFVGNEALTARGIAGGLTYTYVHYFVVVGLAALGAGVKIGILAAGGEEHYRGTAWVACAGLALTMVGIAVIQLVTPPVLFDADVWLRLGTAAAALLLVPFDLSPLVVLVVLGSIMLVQVAFELAGHEAHAHHAPV
jgi:low temperature requirement protein LtrA